jgi:CBS domain-containing protein
VRAAMLTEFHVLAPHDRLGHAADLLVAGSQHDFPVIDAGQFTGVLTRADLLRGLSEGGREAAVSDFARTEFETGEAGEELIPALARLRGSARPCLAVVESDRPVGLLTLENIAEFLMIRTALAGAPHPATNQELVRR